MEKSSLFTLESGRDKLQAILFLHAGGLSGRSWLLVMDLLLIQA
jgi:hypothetical protein